MEALGTISGGAIVVKKYQASATMSTAGVFVLGGDQVSSDLSSVKVGTTSTDLTTGSVGISLDTTGTVAATGMTSNADLLVSCAVNPDLIIRAKMSAGQTADTAMTVGETTAASAGGTVATGVTTIDEGMIWGYNGANKGLYRRLDDTAGSVTINFPNAIASGDKFISANSYPACSTAASLNLGPDLTTSFTQADALTVVPGTNDTFIVFDVELGTEDNDGENNSFYHFIQNQSIFGCTQTSA